MGQRKNLSLRKGPLSPWIPVAQWIKRPPAVREVMGSILVGDSDFVFVPRSCNVDQFSFHISSSSLKFTIFINLSQPCVSLYCNEMFLEMNSQRYLTIIWARDFYLTNRFHVALRLLSNRPQMTSKCGKNKKRGTQGDCRVCHWWFLPHFDVFCDQK